VRLCGHKAHEAAAGSAAVGREGARGRERALSEALDRIDEAIYILREYSRERPEEAEALEDVIYHLEEAGEALERLIERAGRRPRE